ncbi:MAG: hypothetical protein V7607_1222 [Solirubrobacteraceae bacterium]
MARRTKTKPTTMFSAFLLLATLGLIVWAAVADAHHVLGGTASCTGASASYVQFAETNKPIQWRVLADDLQVAAGTSTFAGSSGTITATFAALAAGDHVVRWESTWPGQGEEVGSFEQVVHGCAGQPQTAASSPQTAATPVAAVPTPTAATPTAAKSLPPKVKAKVKVCAHGVKRFGHNGQRLRDSNGRRIALCKSAPRRRQPVTVVPHFTG